LAEATTYVVPPPSVRAIKIFRYVVSLKITIFKFQKSVRAGNVTAYSENGGFARITTFKFQKALMPFQL